MPEQQNIEYKSSWHDNYLKWICGFANAQGGRIYIGKDDAGEVVVALREMLLNALIHRNYMVAPTQLRVYDSKLTLWNHGKVIQ